MTFEPSVFFEVRPDDPPVLKEILKGDQPVWEALSRLDEAIKAFIRPNLPEVVEPYVPTPTPMILLPGGWLIEGFEVRTLKNGKVEVLIQGESVEEVTFISAGAVFADREIEIGKMVTIEAGAFIRGPVIFGDGTEVRQGAYVRGYCYFGHRCVVGHTTEVKHSVFLNEAKAGHFAYIGDSILGRSVNLGAGTKLANLRLDGRNIVIQHQGSRIKTMRRKFGAILGDRVQIGCNSVTNPGTMLGKGSLVAPNATVPPGLYPSGSIIRK